MKSLSMTILLVAVGGLLATTNPKIADYERFLHDRIVQESADKDEFRKALGSLLGGLTSSLLVNATTRSDYVFFSLYDTRFDGKDVKVLGALNNFMVVSRTKFDSRSGD
jgi:hypothetical protein